MIAATARHGTARSPATYRGGAVPRSAPLRFRPSPARPSPARGRGAGRPAGSPRCAAPLGVCSESPRPHGSAGRAVQVLGAGQQRGPAGGAVLLIQPHPAHLPSGPCPAVPPGCGEKLFGLFETTIKTAQVACSNNFSQPLEAYLKLQTLQWRALPVICVSLYIFFQVLLLTALAELPNFFCAVVHRA